jgi:DNA-binding transcriptional ArsR family regulator
MNQKTDGAILAGLVERVQNLLLGLDRRDQLETAGEFVGWLQRQTREQLDDIARGMLLRVLRCAGDPVNYRILERLDELNATNVADLMPETGLDRVAVSERLNDLAQVGLISQDVVDGQVRATSLAVGVRALVERIAIQAGGKLFDGLSHQEPGSRGDITEAGPGDFTV